MYLICMPQTPFQCTPNRKTAIKENLSQTFDLAVTFDPDPVWINSRIQSVVTLLILQTFTYSRLRYFTNLVSAISEVQVENITSLSPSGRGIQMQIIKE